MGRDLGLFEVLGEGGRVGWLPALFAAGLRQIVISRVLSEKGRSHDPDFDKKWDVKRRFFREIWK